MDRAAGRLKRLADGTERRTLSYLSGLRKGEIASLTPSNFKLDAEQPTLTVEAKHSKHRKKDTLPIHMDLVEEVRSWIAGLSLDEPLFPLLGKRKAYKMIQRDLKEAGIPYETEEGIADFHAAGRHTHITGLLKSGVSLVEAKELARHSDVRMTMKYTHIGLEDQAKAVNRLPSLPAPQESAAQKTGAEECLHYVCTPGGAAGQNGSTHVAAGHGNNEVPKRENPCRSKGLDAESQPVSQVDPIYQSMEAAGIEPASRNISAPASTCVVDSLVLARRAPVDRVPVEPAGNFFNPVRTLQWNGASRN